MLEGAFFHSALSPFMFNSFEVYIVQCCGARDHLYAIFILQLGGSHRHSLDYAANRTACIKTH